ncbi:CamS family sex pheromone protein [Carnobacteriaceae bacterium zg-84]|uniref:CamS family sex pheromone protein n=1 Tax=Granulicatella sp. zg-84 TaxID=2678503 RepID=UPI0013BFF5A3|nr:hypothetical protein [Granulicatella sp. zg-84]QMI85535.1 CamS family sex pheromone protein [Carnobacteriaceae bacterium zg-84]
MKFYKRALLIAFLFVLVGCAKNNSTPQTQKVSDEGNVVVTNNSDNANDYKMILLDGKYPTSKTRGASLTLLTPVNIAEFEVGLTDLSKIQFPANQYYFLEGQYLPNQDIQKWLQVQNGENPDGLNKSNTPKAISTILEQDYMLLVDNGYELNGVSIGIALNPQVNDTLLSDNNLLELGKEAATKIVERIRTKEGMGNIPILIGLFKQSIDNGASRGSYLSYAVSKSGVSLSEWKPVNVEKRLFPLDNDKTDDVSVFSTFKKSVESFFPNLNGIVGEATFIDGTMSELNITVTTQFYGQSEMIALTQFLVEKANAYSASNLNVKIKVESVRGTEAVIHKKQGETVFHSVVLH